MSKIFTYVAILVISLINNLIEAQYKVDLTQYSGKYCDRPCVANQKRICYFEWVLEHYHAMGPACGRCPDVEADCNKPQCILGDGIQKGVMSINRMIPGPPIFVCKGDKIIVDIVNTAQGTSASIHWHGLHMVDTPYMDGVPYLTQCPIRFDSTFRYTFYATQAGTQFYHSHSGHHKLNGQYGALIIREPENLTPNIGEYDKDLSEHYMLVSDWRHDYAEQSFPGLPRGVSFPESLLINGRGTYVDAVTLRHTSIVPVTKYLVKPGLRYRFRIISSVSLTCAFSIQIQGHRLVIIATDSFPVDPYDADTIVVNAGERYDCVVETKRGKGDYWVRVRGIGGCAANQPLDSFALLRYVTSDSDIKRPQPEFPAYTNTFTTGASVNNPSASCFDDDYNSCAADLTAVERDDDLVRREPDYRLMFNFYNFVIPVDQAFIPGKYVRFNNPIGSVIAAGIVNNMSLTVPSKPILTQYQEIDQKSFCDLNRWPDYCKGKPICPCTYREKIRTNSIVELCIVDGMNIPNMSHPFHLHGHKFAVMGMQQASTNMQQSMELAQRLRKSRPVFKDTISVPTNGLVVLRFRADNPGIWLMHCHYEMHLTTGMAFIFQIGEPNEWVQAPAGFPKCGDYKPDVKQIGY